MLAAVDDTIPYDILTILCFGIRKSDELFPFTTDHNQLDERPTVMLFEEKKYCRFYASFITDHNQLDEKMLFEEKKVDGGRSSDKL
uniref:Uncharacterized protein n=1 Tax=Strigamia maritima TaxID=126957 RepID=T1J052_STRMM